MLNITDLVTFTSNYPEIVEISLININLKYYHESCMNSFFFSIYCIFILLLFTSVFSRVVKIGGVHGPGVHVLYFPAPGRMQQNFPLFSIFRNFRPTLRQVQMKFRKMSVPFAFPPGISGIFGGMEIKAYAVTSVVVAS